MPSLSTMDHGYDSTGVTNYLEQLRAIVLTQAADQVMDYAEIEKACNQNWEGQAKDTFISNLKSTAQHVSDQFNSLYSILLQEVEAVEGSMADADNTMIDARG